MFFQHKQTEPTLFFDTSNGSQKLWLVQSLSTTNLSGSHTLFLVPCRRSDLFTKANVILIHSTVLSMKQWTPKLNAVNTITSNKKQRIFYICLRGMPFCLRDNPHSSRQRFSQPSKVAYISAIHNVTSNNTRPTTNSSRIGLPAPSWSRGNPPFPDRRQPREVNALSKLQTGRIYQMEDGM
jgi:hypothetical protein